MIRTPIEADRGRDPAPSADALAEKGDRQRGHEQRRDETGGGSFRDRQIAQAGDEEQRGGQERESAHQLQSGPLRVRSANSGEPGSIAGDMISANTRNRIQVISIEGSVADRYFAVTSEVPRNTVEARISAMPLERTVGACRRGSLRRLLLRHGQCGTVQPGGCGGWRGHGKTLARKIGRIERAPKQRLIGAARTRSENRHADMRDRPRPLAAATRHRT